MKVKIFELLKKNQIDFKISLDNFYDYLIYSCNNKIIITSKTFYDKDLIPYYSLHIKVVFKSEKFEYNSFSCDLESCVSFFNDIMEFLGVFKNAE